MTVSEFIARHRTDPVEPLAFTASRLLGAADAAFALRQIEGWQRLRHKVPSWAACECLLYPARLALEQCSGEPAARYKACIASRLFPDGGTMADLTGGFGVDFFFMARHFGRATYVERNAELAHIVARNLQRMGLKNADFIANDGLCHLPAMEPVDLLFLDPARRDGGGRKTVRLEDCEPNVPELMPLLRGKCRTLMLKLSPMLDVEQAVASLGSVSEVHVFSHRGECKDLVLVVDPQGGGGDEPQVFCAEDDRCFCFRKSDEIAQNPPFFTDFPALPGLYLYEPGPALLKGGAFRLPAVRYGLQKLHPNSHLYVAARRVAGFPGRVFRVRRVSGFGKRELRAFVQGVAQANLAVRNFPAPVAELRKRLRVKEGGEEYWFATTLADGSRRLLACTKA